MLVKNLPNKIHLAGLGEIEGSSSGDSVDGYEAGATITPGFLVEKFDTAGKRRWRAHSNAAGIPPKTFALNQVYLDKGVDDLILAGEGLDVLQAQAGTVVWGILESGATGEPGTELESAGNGKFQDSAVVTAAAGLALFVCLDSVGTVGADTRIAIEVK